MQCWHLSCQSCTTVVLNLLDDGRSYNFSLVATSAASKVQFMLHMYSTCDCIMAFFIAQGTWSVNYKYQEYIMHVVLALLVR